MAERRVCDITGSFLSTLVHLVYFQALVGEVVGDVESGKARRD